LLHQTAYVPLVEKPRIAGQHLLEIDIPGDEPITLLSDPAGPETAAGFPLAVRPVTRPQMAQLFSLIEKLTYRASSICRPLPARPAWSRARTAR
jgi:hypothetical protein